jgi:hypothetical protein
MAPPNGRSVCSTLMVPGMFGDHLDIFAVSINRGYIRSTKHGNSARPDARFAQFAMPDGIMSRLFRNVHRWLARDPHPPLLVDPAPRFSLMSYCAIYSFCVADI